MGSLMTWLESSVGPLDYMGCCLEFPRAAFAHTPLSLVALHSVPDDLTGKVSRSSGPLFLSAVVWNLCPAAPGDLAVGVGCGPSLTGHCF